MPQGNSVSANDKSQSASEATNVYPEVIIISSDSEDETEFVPDSSMPTRLLEERGASDAIAAVYDEVVASVFNVLPDSEVNSVMKLADEFFGTCSCKSEVVAKICDQLLQGIINTSDVIVPNLSGLPKDTTESNKTESVPHLANGSISLNSVHTVKQNLNSAASQPVIKSIIGGLHSVINAGALPRTDATTGISACSTSTEQSTKDEDDFSQFANERVGELRRGVPARLEQNANVKSKEGITIVPLVDKTNELKNVYLVDTRVLPQLMDFQIGGLNKTNPEQLPKNALTVRESLVATKKVNERNTLTVTESQDVLNHTIGKIPSQVTLPVNKRKLKKGTKNCAKPEEFPFAHQVLPPGLRNMFYENGINPAEQVPVKFLPRQDKSVENNLSDYNFGHKKVVPTATIVRPVEEETLSNGIHPTVGEVPRLESGVFPLHVPQQNAVVQETNVPQSVDMSNDMQTLKRHLPKNSVISPVTFPKRLILSSVDSASFNGSNFPEESHTENDVPSMQNSTGDAFPSEDAAIDDEEYECSCCYNTVPFDYMVQCGEGHLFCCECLRRYTQEAVYGGGKASLMCMSDGCAATFPTSQLHRALPTALYNKYEERVEEEFISLANLEDFVRCPHCNVGAELVNTQQIFNCPNLVCQKRVCRLCKVDWVDHEGLSCDQVEKKDETKIRLAFEEKMAQAKIRQCSNCNAKYTKEDGCNKITCRCSMTMCYVCRQAKIDYHHFCNNQQHGKRIIGKCNKCKLCSLWSKGEDDDNLAIQELKNDAQAERATQGFTDEKEIGVPSESKKKPTPPKPKKATPKRPTPRRRGRGRGRGRNP